MTRKRQTIIAWIAASAWILTIVFVLAAAAHAIFSPGLTTHRDRMQHERSGPTEVEVEALRIAWEEMFHRQRTGITREIETMTAFQKAQEEARVSARKLDEFGAFDQLDVDLEEILRLIDEAEQDQEVD